jgi:predicted amidohydrolase
MLAQVDCHLGEVDHNFKVAAELVDQARAQGVELIVFPELSLTGYSLGNVADDLAMEVTDPRITALAEHAGDIGVLVGFHEGGRRLRTYNSAAYFQHGKLVHLHRKLYLPTYDLFEERKHFSPGTSMRAFETSHGMMSTLICNDAWQPQLPFLAVQDGAWVLLVPTTSAQSRFPERYDSRTYWRDITSFYARMFECYVVFVNRVGTEAPLRFWGGSHVTDPWGTRIAEAGEDSEDTLVVDLDLNAVRRRRREVPLVKEARLAVLEKEIHRLAEEGGDL